MTTPKNILIVRTDKIGDVVLTTPVAKIIKEHYPNCKITFLVKSYTKPLVDNNPFIDNIIVLEEKDNKTLFSKNLQKLKSAHFDTAIVVYPRFRLSLMLYLAGIKNRIGTGYRWYSFLFNKKIYEHRRSGEKHELEYNLGLLDKIGIKDVGKETVAFNIHPSDKSEQKIESLLAEAGIEKGEKTIIIHPGSGGSSIDLPVSSFIELTKLLAQGLEYNILITGSENERNICEQFIVNDNVKSFAGLLNLDELIALIGKSEMLIANSTGPIHIAAAMDKCVVGFYPKIKECSVKRWGPYTDKRIIFEPALNCTDCTREQCTKLNCMNSIDVNNVYQETIKLLNKN